MYWKTLILYSRSTGQICSFYTTANFLARTRGGRSHFFRHRLRSCSKMLESGSGNFQIRESDSCSDSCYTIDSTEIYLCFYLRDDHAGSCYCRNWKLAPDSGPFFHKISWSVPEKTQNPAMAPSGKNTTSALSTNGFNNWCNLHTRFCKHKNSKNHLEATWSLYGLPKIL